MHVALIETSPFQKFKGKCRSTGELTRISSKIDSTRQSSPALRRNTCNIKTVFIDNEVTTFSKIRFNYLVVLTGPYNEGPSTPHIYIIKLELTGIHIISFLL